MEDQLGALGLVLNCITLWNTSYLDAALGELREEGYPVLAEDVARLTPFMRRHINVHGHYSFQLPELRGGRRQLRDPDEPDDEFSDAEFREGAVRIVKETGKPVAQVARDLGISSYTLHNWVKLDRERDGEGGALGESEREELARLRAQKACRCRELCHWV